jgi:hypothetical protein
MQNEHKQNTKGSNELQTATRAKSNCTCSVYNWLIPWIWVLGTLIIVFTRSVTTAYPESHESSTHQDKIFLFKIHFNIILHQSLGLLSGLFPSVFLTKLLSECLATTTWRILILQMEETITRYGRKLRIYWRNIRGQLTRGCFPTMKTPHHEELACCKMSHRVSGSVGKGN